MESLTPVATALLDHAADEAFADLDTDPFRGATILVTGATGLVGGAFCRALLRSSAIRGLRLRLLLPARDPIRAAALFPAPDPATRVEPILWPDLLSPLEAPPAEYAVHAATATKSIDMARRPVDTLLAAFEGTRGFLRWATDAKPRKAVFLSSLEIYGTPPENGPDMEESSNGTLDPTRPRSSYPEGKRAAEALCAAAAAQRGVPVCIARLAQTFGPGAAPDDPRAFAEFARAAVSGRDIALHTAGRTARNYCHVSDAAGAILTLLGSGVPGEAYNVANESSFVSIRELAERFAATGGRGSRVICDNAGESVFGYAPELRIRLLSGKLSLLGFQSRLGLDRMVGDLIAWYRAILPKRGSA